MAVNGRFAVELYWLPLGAGGRSVRMNGRIYEAVCARREHRLHCDLYHSALKIWCGSHFHVIEMAPVWSEDSDERGAVAEGAVGSRALGVLRAFRYEVRCWRDGRIPDAAEAVESPQCLSHNASTARRILELVHTVPTPVWGRDELHTGDMWNSNSVIAWLLVSSGIGPRHARLPAGGRAPGWDAGVALARRSSPWLPAHPRMTRRRDATDFERVAAVPELHVGLPRDVSAAAIARREAHDWLSALAGTQRLDELMIVVSELVTNAIEHGKGAISMRLRVADGKLIGEVIDEGTGFERELRAARFDDPRGRGLALVEAITSRWGVYEGTTHVWFEMPLSPSAP